MNDEQFERNIEWLLVGPDRQIGEFMRARDTAQREALARVEAQIIQLSKDTTEVVQSLAAKRYTTQAQLARAMRLYFSIRHIVVDTANSESSGKYHLIDDAFMDIAQFAQAEQQEARAVLATQPTISNASPKLVELLACPCGGTEIHTVSDLREAMIRCPGCGYSTDIHGSRELAARQWNRRATQPAVRKHVAPVSIVTFEKAITEEALAAGFNEPDLSRHEVDGCEVYVQQHIQAAYSGWKLALEVSPAQQAIDLLVEALVAPNTSDLPGRIDRFLDSQPAVRGAEHE